MITSLIVAIAQNNVIGKDNDLIWRLPNDMKFFKETTLNHHIVTGRKNYISIPKKFRPLPNRINIVLTRQTSFNEEGCVVLHSLEAAIEHAKNNNETELFIIGGGQIYKEALEKDLIDKMYITQVHQEFEGDTFFPKIDNTVWKKVSETNNPVDEKHQFPYSFVVYEKLS
ncbi:MAG: dihydrofolate reductase [Flavobacteriales bacterium]|nr:dihydrofolate reductase [Flavobacteriales bacterium]NQX97649.1 dihydrofolate reductase [Flavobacteriales bacterium]